MSISELKSRCSITDVWSALGGAPLRHGRAAAFWRPKADGLSVSIDAVRGVWFDFRDNVDGDIVELVRTVRQCDFRTAVVWLAGFTGVPLSHEQNNKRDPVAERNWAADLERAGYWGIAAVALAERDLEELSPFDPRRMTPTSLLNAIRLGDASLVVEYRRARESNPRLTAAMVRAGRRADARRQRQLARWCREHYDGD